MIEITLNQIKSHSPCKDGWMKVLKANGGTKADFDKPFPVSSILDSNDLDDTLWVLRCLPEYDSVWRKFACDCALINIEKIKPYCSEEDYDLIYHWLTTQDESVKSAARSAADSVAESAAWAAAWSAAWAAESAADSVAESAADSVAESAAWAAAWSAARSAARSAADSVAESAAWSAAWSAIETKLIEVLNAQNI